MGLSLLIH